ncbi:MAG: hypothetical protein V5A62_08350 [Haloarculaceae archaeon]
MLGSAAGLTALSSLPAPSGAVRTVQAGPATPTVLTRNAYLGVELFRLFRAESGPEFRRLAGEPLGAVDTGVYEARADAIAAEIGATDADVVALAVVERSGEASCTIEGPPCHVTTSDRSGGDREGGRPTAESHDPQSTPLETPAASRGTLARRLRAVERALGGTDDVDLETATERAETDELDAMADRLDTGEARIDAVEDRLDALSEAVRAIGECLVSRDRARRLDDGTESVRRAVEALTDAGDRTGTTDGAGTIDRGDACTVDPSTGSGDLVRTTVVDVGEGPTGESPAEWLDRVAAGGVTPPPIE